jgi:hypothetical protein
MVSLKNVLDLLYFSFLNVTFPSTLHVFIIFFGTEFEVLTVVRIRNVVWVRTLCSHVRGYECFGRAFWGCLHRHLEDEGSISWPKPRYTLVTLNDPKTQKTIILNLNILHFLCIVSLLQNNRIHILGNKYTLLLYTVFWCEQIYVGENIM